MALKSRIDTHNVRVFGRFIEKLAATPDGARSLLDHSLIVYGGGIGNGNLRRHSDIRCLTFGSLGGRLQTRRHTRQCRRRDRGVRRQHGPLDLDFPTGA